jgi:hypothetical protein
MTTEKKLHRTPEEMFPMVEAWEISGKSLKEFCIDSGIRHTTMQYWVRKFKGKGNPPSERSGGFQEIRLGGDSSFSSGVEIIFADGTRLRVSGKVDSAWIKSILPVYSRS